MHNRQSDNKSTALLQTISKVYDSKEIRIPDLRKNVENIPFIVAAINGYWDKDQIEPKTGKFIPSLRALFKTNTLNSEAKQFFLPFLFNLAIQIHRKIPNQYDVFKFLTEQGLETKYLLLLQMSDIDHKEFDIEILKAMIDGGASPNTNINGYSVLHASVIAQDHFNFENRVNFLVEKGANPNLCETERGFGTMLHMCLANEIFDDQAAHAKAKFLIQKLVGSEYDWNSVDGENKTILIIAAKMRATTILRILIEAKEKFGINLDLDKCDNQGRTALHFCAALGNVEGAKLLIDAGASLNVPDKKFRKALSYTQLNESFIRGILHEIHIDPDRDEKALHNYLIGLDGKPIEINVSYDQRIALKANKYNSDSYGKDILNFLESTFYTSEHTKRYDMNFMLIQFQLSGKPLINSCLEGQKQVYNLFKEKLEESFPVPRARDSLFSEENPFQLLLKKTKAYVKENPGDEIFLKSVEIKALSKALRIACNAGRRYLVDILLEYLKASSSLSTIAFINEVPSNGKSALHWAAKSAKETGDAFILNRLLEYNPDRNILDNEGKLFSDYFPSFEIRPN